MQGDHTEVDSNANRNVAEKWIESATCSAVIVCLHTQLCECVSAECVYVAVNVRAFECVYVAVNVCAFECVCVAVNGAAHR